MAYLGAARSTLCRVLQVEIAELLSTNELQAFVTKSSPTTVRREIPQRLAGYSANGEVSDPDG